MQGQEVTEKKQTGLNDKDTPKPSPKEGEVRIERTPAEETRVE